MPAATKPSRRRVRRVALVLVAALAALQVAGWFAQDGAVGHFRTARGREAYTAAYRDALATFAAPTATQDVATSFGIVRAYAWRPADPVGVPVVLLPGRGSGVPMWSVNLPLFAERRTVYALDALGDAGLSAQSVPLGGAADQAAWIDETLAGLGVERAHVVGHSFGAASAAALAVHRPARVATLTLLEPAFVLNLPSLGVLAWSVPASLPFLPQAWRNAAIAHIAGEDPGAVDQNDPVAAMITLGGTEYSAQLPTPAPLSDAQLGNLRMPTYVALAENSPITRGRAAPDKARLIPYAEVRVWPGTTHSLPMQVAVPLAAELDRFWTAHSP